MRAGHEEVLSPEAMAARAAALQANQQLNQKWLQQIVQPLTDLVPGLLLQQQQQQASNRSNRSSSSTAGAAAVAMPTLLVIDGYNLLHQHSSTKQLILQGRLHEAQARLHTLLRTYIKQQPGLHALLVYDAHSVSRNSSSTRQQLADRLHTVYKAGQEADSVIIDLVERLLLREAAAAEAGHLGLSTPTFCTLVVHTNDNRIKSAVADAAVSAARHRHQHVVRVQVSSSSQLSAQLQLVENKLFAGQQQPPLQQQQQQWDGSSSLPGRLPDPRRNTEAWARAILARSSSSAGSSWESDSEDSEEPSSSSAAASSSSSKRRRRRLTQQQQLNENAAHAQLLAASLSDEQLLQLSASGGTLVAAVSSVEDVEGVGEQPAATTAAPGAGAAEGQQKQKPVGSSSTSQQLDEVLSMDIDSLLDGL
jgi:hypothetical protein